MAKTFSRWVTETVKLFDTEIQIKLRAFDQREAPSFKAAVASHYSEQERRPGETDEQFSARLENYLGRWMELSKSTFERYVRVIEPLVCDEDPSITITDGASLFAQAPGDLVLKIMIRLSGLASLGDKEGKSSGSPSTSTAAAGLAPRSTDCPAPSIESAASPEPSTATATTAEPLSFREA